jgi:hypothetical protein
MSEFCFRWFVNMPTRSGGCLVKRVGVLPAPSSFFDGLFELKVRESVRHESFKVNRHTLTSRTGTSIRIRSFLLSVQLVRMIVGLSKVRCMNKIRFMVRCGLPLCVHPGGPCEERDPSSCPVGNDLFNCSNLFDW